MQSLNEKYIQKEIDNLLAARTDPMAVYEVAFLNVTILFLQEILLPDTKNPIPDPANPAMLAFSKYQKTYPAINHQQKLIQIFIYYGVFNYYREKGMFLELKSKEISHYIVNCTTKISEITPLALMALTISPSSPSHSIKKGLSHQQKLQLFNKLSNIDTNMDRDLFIRLIINKYCKHFSLDSKNSSSQRLTYYLKRLTSISKKWKKLLEYITDVDKNNGKNLFLIINSVALQFQNLKQDYLGFHKISLFFRSEIVASGLINQDVSKNIINNFIDLQRCS